jgi:hypothetical protein
MQKRTTVWYTLGEAEKATGVPRTRLDHACRVRRLPYRRSETGARLLSHEVVEKLRKQGLKSFPRPYDPIATSNEQEASPPGATQGVGLMPQRERLEQKRIEVEEMRVNRELRHLKYQEQQEKAERRAAALVERQAQAEQHAQARRHQEQLRLEEAREAAALERDSLEAEARDSHLQWEVDWLDHTLNHLLPSDLPPTFELEVHKAVAELLAKLDAHQPEKLTKRLVQAAIDRALQPWRKQKGD